MKRKESNTGRNMKIWVVLPTILTIITLCWTIVWTLATQIVTISTKVNDIEKNYSKLEMNYSNLIIKIAKIDVALTFKKNDKIIVNDSDMIKKKILEKFDDIQTLKTNKNNYQKGFYFNDKLLPQIRASIEDGYNEIITLAMTIGESNYIDLAKKGLKTLK